jgi:thioredoxin 1
MLATNLKHLTSEQDFKDTLANNDNVMICCGRMGPMCIPVYGVMEELQGDYKHVAFRDLEFDGPYGHLVRNLPECSNFRGLPFTVYFHKGTLVKATSSIQSREQVTDILDNNFSGKTPA